MGYRNTFQLLEKMEFQGIDVCLETSLLEYGMVWKETDTEYIFLYNGTTVYHGANETEYGYFYWCGFSKDTDITVEFDWVEWESFLQFIDSDMAEFKNTPLPFQIFQLNLYYGFLNIFGEQYYEGFKFEKLGYILKLNETLN